MARYIDEIVYQQKDNPLSSEFWKTPWVDIANPLSFPASARLNKSTVVTNVNTWVVTIFGTTFTTKKLKRKFSMTRRTIYSLEFSKFNNNNKIRIQL